MKVIDFHVHALVKEVFDKEPKLHESQQSVYGLATSPQPIETLLYQFEEADVVKAVLLPLDCSSKHQCMLPTNEAVASLVDTHDDMFIGFASVDPNKGGDAVEDLRKAVEELKLRGLKLNPALQGFDPSSNDSKTIYEEVNRLDIPLLVHTGMVWQSKHPIEYCHPAIWEKIARSYPTLQIILAHCGWPWAWEAAVVAMRHPNVYLDVSNTYTGSPAEHLRYLLTEVIPTRVTERFLGEKIVFGSDYPRIEVPKMVSAIQSLNINMEVKRKILFENASKLLSI